MNEDKQSKNQNTENWNKKSKKGICGKGDAKWEQQKLNH